MKHASNIEKVTLFRQGVMKNKIDVWFILPIFGSLLGRD